LFKTSPKPPRWSFVEGQGLKTFGYIWADFRRSWNRRAAERGIPQAERAAFLGHLIEVNERHYGSQANHDLIRRCLGASLADERDTGPTTGPKLDQRKNAKLK
jgi:hypothetical protein